MAEMLEHQAAEHRRLARPGRDAGGPDAT